jgi:hypothetical protein
MCPIERIADFENLIGLLVEQQMIIAKVRTAHVPVEVLGLDVEHKYVRQKRIERDR